MKKIRFKMLFAMIVSLLLPQGLQAAIREYDFTKITNVTFTYGTTPAARLNTTDIFCPSNCEALDGRFAFQNVSSRVWSIKDAGMTVNGGDSHFALLNLKAGDKVTIVISSGNIKIRKGNAYNTTTTANNGDWEDFISGHEYVMDKDGAFMLQGKNGVVISSIKLETVASETISKPTINVTGTNGIKRIITITPGVGSMGSKATATYYTLDGSNPTESDTREEYSEPFEIEETKQIKAVSYLSELASEIDEKEVTAGVKEKLATPVIYVSSFINNGVYYTPIFDVRIDNSTVIGSPEAVLSIKLIKKDGTELSGLSFPYTPSEAGELVVTASAEGYEESESKLQVFVNYALEKSTVDLSKVNSSNIAEEFGSTWTVSTSSTRWSNWSKTGGVDADGTSNGGEQYYTASSSDGETTIYDFLKVGNGTNLLIGYGMGRNDKAGSCWIEAPVKNAIAEYLLTRYGANEYNVYVTETESSSLSISLKRYGEDILKKASYYVPVETIPVTISSDYGYSTFSSDVDVDFSAEESLVVYTAKMNEDNTVVKLTEVADKKVPAGAGVLLKGEGTFAGIVTTGVEAFADNAFVASEGGTAVTRADGIYVLNNKSGIGFYPFVGTLSKGKAHLVIANSEAKSIKMSFGDETTGISEIETTGEASGVYHTLSGIRVQNPAKGLYILNGKKVIIK